MRERELIVYRDFEDGELLYDMAWLMSHYDDPEQSVEKLRITMYDCLHKLIDEAGSYGFHGNLWHTYLANLLVNNENSYSCGCEVKGEITGTINQAALHDIEIFRELFEFDFKPVMDQLGVPGFAMALDYDASTRESKVYNTRICGRICELAEQLAAAVDAPEMKEVLTNFYKDYGVGKFGLHKSFRVTHDDDGVHIVPILNIAHVKLDDLVGYENAKRKLKNNTESFVMGLKANNCLLYGDAGTGKSSCIKAIANEYYGRGLRVIEIYKHQFRDLHDVIAQIKKRNYKFIIYMDDLSFEDFETEYKYLKAIIEGGLEKRPANVLIYATSNRRHLIRESSEDNENLSTDLHSVDTVQEKLSLAYRFGVTIYFGSPDKRQFDDIVKALAARNGILLPEEELLAEAHKWELNHGGLSGRTATQFIDYLLGAHMST
ncbi:MAG: ATP-binding protein [Lachnospiraceae bacterium]|nr:ATP-binding protein [Lachnospiraceae bacterium]